ncbi:structural protein [Bacillus paralicheniformis]|uniref:structural protein n=1 Tax=Bacillus paralicheniformis TaxID=1648923 RepID=UPI00203BD45D|nr:structural protein [Bacillus paralicheniformis]MCM3425554.1 structural protein [Bacillus paralicheniformis]
MASLKGVSANPTKANYSLSTDKEVVVAVKNDNDYIAGPNLFPQRRTADGKWVDLGINSPNPLNPDQKDYDSFSIKEYLNKAGTYRFKCLVERYDSKGNHVKTEGTFYTSNIYIK